MSHVRTAFVAVLLAFTSIAVLAKSGEGDDAIHTQVVYIQNCSCATNDTAQCTKTRTQGQCYPDPITPTNTRIITCMDNTQHCAQLIKFNSSAQCATGAPPIGSMSVVCGMCQKLSNNPVFYGVANCDPNTQTITWDMNCNMGCSVCQNPGQLVHPFMQCSSGGQDGSSIYNQGVSPCDAVSIAVYSGSNCSSQGGQLLDQFAVAQYDCTLGEYFSCSPKSPPPVPTGNAQQVMVSVCQFGSAPAYGCVDEGNSCKTFAFPTNSCQPLPFAAPPPIIRHRTNCSRSSAICADLAIHNNSYCNAFIGRSTPVCGSCAMLGNDTTYTLVNCNQTDQSVTFSKSCNKDCSICNFPNLIRHSFLQCTTGYFPKTTVYNRGLFPCDTVTFEEFSSFSCTPQSLQRVHVVAENICQFDRLIQCKDRYVTVQNCSSGISGNAPAQVVAEGACQPDAFGMFRQYQCMNKAQECAKLVRYSDPLCQNFQNAFSVVCNTCVRMMNPFMNQPTYQQIICDNITQTITVNDRCNPDCSSCMTPGAVVNNFGECSNGAQNDYIYNEGIAPCDAVEINVYSNASCPQATLVQSFTTGQFECGWGGEFISCSGDPLPPVPQGANELISTQCFDPTGQCSQNCQESIVTAGGCVENFRGSAGASRISCDSTASYCADLSVHAGPNCTNKVGNFHPVCDTCAQWPNQTGIINGWSLTKCDPIRQDVIISFGCDSTCTVCSQPHAVVHPYLSCTVSDMNAQHTIINRGIVPCATTTLTGYSSATCDPGTEISTFPIAAGFCDMNQINICANQPIEIQNCSCTQNCMPLRVPAGTCQPTPSQAGHSRVVQCFAEWEQCVHLTFYNDANCNSFAASLSGVCGACNKVILPNGATDYIRLMCNFITGAVSFDTKCNADCSACSGIDVSVNPNQCTPQIQYPSVYSQGFTLCDAVNVTQYGEPNCQGNPIGQYMHGQHNCNFGEYVSCPARPIQEPRRFNGKVITNECPYGDNGCTNCQQTVQGSGDCQASTKVPGWSRKVTCGGTGMCADMVMHNGSTCSGWLGNTAPVCGSCTQWPGEETWTQILCDLASEVVTVKRNCSKNCGNCVLVEYHAPLQCSMVMPHSEGFHTGLHSVFNRGLKPCQTAFIQDFSSTNCDLNTVENQFHVPEGECQFGHYVQCTPHILRIQNCSQGCGGTQCPLKLVAEGSCAPDSFGFYRRYQCTNKAKQCAMLVQFMNSESCEAPTGFGQVNAINAVCGSCLRQPDPINPTGPPMHMRIRCDHLLQSVHVDSGCDFMCNHCTVPDAAVHPFMQCSQVNHNLDPNNPVQSVYNQGISPCESVTYDVYADNFCSGSARESWEVGQRDCGMFDGLFIACDSNPTLDPTPQGQIVMSSCPPSPTDEYFAFVVADGACAPPPPGETRFQSHRMACDVTTGSTCAHLTIHNGTGCNDFVGVRTPVCGACAPEDDGTYTSVSCLSDLQVVNIKFQCNADCSVCNSPTQTIQAYTCVPGYIAGTSVQSRGLFQCPTVTFTHYSSQDCTPGTSIGTFVAAADQCEHHGHRLQCAKNIVTVENCTCPTCPSKQVAVGNCVLDNFGKYRTYNCLNQNQMCANMIQFTDDQCSNYDSGFSVVCGTCFKRTSPITGLVSWASATCNMTSQTVTITTDCQDSQCLSCQGNQYEHTFNGCTADKYGYVFNNGIVPCDGVEITVFQDSQCSTVPLEQFVTSQYYCAFDEYVACTGATAVSPVRSATSVQVFTCPFSDETAAGCSGKGCTLSIEPVSSCAPSWHPGRYRSLTCNAQESLCADMVMHNSSDCSSGFMGMHQPICNQCSLSPRSTTSYMWVDCDQFSQSVTILLGCNSDCSECNSTNLFPLTTCEKEPFHTLPNGMPIFYMMSRGIFPCSTVTMTEHTDSGCQTPAVNTFMLAQDVCENGARLSCVNSAAPSPNPNTGNGGGGGSSSNGTAIGLGVTAAILGCALLVVGYRLYKKRAARSTSDWGAMNEVAPTPSNAQGSYGAVQ